MQDATISLGISSCLCGNPVRYDGSHKSDPSIYAALSRWFTLHPLCPEVDSGMPVPRPAMNLYRDGETLRLKSVVDGIDHTWQLATWSEQAVTSCKQLDLCGLVLKSRSPSCALSDAPYYPERGRVVTFGPGLFARAVIEQLPHIGLIDEAGLHDPDRRAHFADRVFVCRRWRDLLAAKPDRTALTAFHASHKYLLMAYRPDLATRLGRCVATCKRRLSAADLQSYGHLLFAALRQPTTPRKQTNALQHMAGYFKKQLSADQKAHLQETILRFHQGMVPLIVPLTLISLLTRLFDQNYLATQVWLTPSPAELMLKHGW